MAAAGPPRFVALGDSITVGLGDGVTMGRERRHGAPARGFAARLAERLGPPGAVEYTNLATTGATAQAVRTRQLPVALALAPQVATVVAGMNDVLKPSFDPLRLRQDLVWTVGRLRAQGATVVTATMPDPGRLLRLPGPLAGLLSDRVGRLNAAVHATARADPGVLVVDLARHPAVRRRSTFDVDRVHPGPYGHELIAQAFALRLAAAGVPPVSPPAWAPRPDPPESEIPAPGTLRHGYWLLSVGLPWLAGRCLPKGDPGPSGAENWTRSPPRRA
ncbi:SGNH/GDSL hydrolase family protein [Frankia sp. AgKG'84/4]|uniref:SGNH/GDSL hydrolase family protein n=1 Tax=Frankia sp. AgKG'84/4 TaxID=573490 RepID=UPI00200C276C|nr:SGNH/GDSL hydrolase family protein [Frankia sp. AgKG'84/4]MCL9797336.1 SGNH/GDSL hydrolase family protein [Frankia sp. AgKG'84/4]